MTSYGIMKIYALLHWSFYASGNGSPVLALNLVFLVVVHEHLHHGVRAYAVTMPKVGTISEHDSLLEHLQVAPGCQPRSHDGL